jgi:NADPH2:quinone reductase
MRAIVLAAHGGPDALRLEERPAPSPSEGEIVVENQFCGVNFIDIYQRKGLYPVALPAVLGCEGAGCVVAVGAGVSNLRVGDRIAYLSTGGGYAEQTAVAAWRAAPLPAAIGADIAAASFLKGLTAEMLLRQVYPVTSGAKALVYAAAGGVGTILTQWAALLGVEVIAVVGNDEKAAAARRLGAAHAIVRTKTESISAAVREATGGAGVDVVYDSIGAATFADSLDSLAPRGMMVSYGNASGPVPSIAPLELGRRGSLFLTRPSLFHYATPERFAGMASALFELMESGRIRIDPPATFRLDEAAAAQAKLESGSTMGSLALKP